jgi:hypothetical protein
MKECTCANKVYGTLIKQNLHMIFVLLYVYKSIVIDTHRVVKKLIAADYDLLSQTRI